MGYSWGVTTEGRRPTGRTPAPFAHLAAWLRGWWTT